MGERIIKTGRVKCVHCGQLLGFEINKAWRKTQRVICPACGKTNWAMLDTTEQCLFRLAEYEQSGMVPVEIAAMSVLYQEAKKYPELKESIEKWEEKLNDAMAEKEK